MKEDNKRMKFYHHISADPPAFVKWTWSYKRDIFSRPTLREDILKNAGVLSDFVQITSPTPTLPPIWTTCTTFFERQKRRFKRHSK